MPVTFNTSDPTGEKSLKVGQSNANVNFEEILNKPFLYPNDFLTYGGSSVIQPVYSAATKPCIVINIPNAGGGFTGIHEVTNQMYNGLIYPHIIYSGDVTSTNKIDLTVTIAPVALGFTMGAGTNVTLSMFGPVTLGNVQDFISTTGIPVDGSHFLFGINVERSASDAYTGNFHVYLVRLRYIPNI